jgi:hypothetical protein
MSDTFSELLPPSHLRPVAEMVVIAMVSLVLGLSVSSASEPKNRDRLSAGSVWKGVCFQGDRVFGIQVKITKRTANDLWGEIDLDFRDGCAGKLTFEGMVEGDRVSWITDKKAGDVTFPGLYVGTLEGKSLSGVWRVPTFRQRDKFVLKLEE